MRGVTLFQSDPNQLGFNDQNTSQFQNDSNENVMRIERYRVNIEKMKGVT